MAWVKSIRRTYILTRWDVEENPPRREEGVKKYLLIAVFMLAGCNSERVEATDPQEGVYIENKGNCMAYVIIGHPGGVKPASWPMQIEPGRSAFIPVEISEIPVSLICRDGDIFVKESPRGK